MNTIQAMLVASAIGCAGWALFFWAVGVLG